ncbi:unnamed protein product [Ambrosiozyma monospora]|uniref:Unnamed protein product n=1 Tax=Ambrosiozyma monospora TaxID=43982 RepID=A0A9W6Z4C2_AMBMO|nr:unnamed protein product [Ambrosiozyma monospora]
MSYRPLTLLGSVDQQRQEQEQISISNFTTQYDINLQKLNQDVQEIYASYNYFLQVCSYVSLSNIKELEDFLNETVNSAHQVIKFVQRLVKSRATEGLEHTDLTNLDLTIKAYHSHLLHFIEKLLTYKARVADFKISDGAIGGLSDSSTTGSSSNTTITGTTRDSEQDDEEKEKLTITESLQEQKNQKMAQDVATLEAHFEKVDSFINSMSNFSGTLWKAEAEMKKQLHKTGADETEEPDVMYDNAGFSIYSGTSGSSTSSHYTATSMDSMKNRTFDIESSQHRYSRHRAGFWICLCIVTFFIFVIAVILLVYFLFFKTNVDYN